MFCCCFFLSFKILNPYIKKFRGSCSPVTLLTESLFIFSRLAVTETATSLSTAKMECEGSRNAADANLQKKNKEGTEVKGE
jgi:hypothetical protein